MTALRLLRWLPAAVARRPSQRGQVLVLFALALIFILVPAVAIGIDGARAFEERRAAQIAVDQAAIAAARSACVISPDEATAIAKGREAAVSNGYTNPGLGAESGNTVVVVRPDPTNKPYMYQATIDTRIPGTFSRVIPGGGFNSFHVTVTATADGSNCGTTGTAGPSVGPIYAGGATCPGGSLNNIEISGNDHIVTGLTQTNGNFKNGGARNSFQNAPNPSVRYVGTFDGGDGTNIYNGPAEDINTAPAPAWPTGWAPADQTTAMWDAYAAAPRVNTNAANMVTSIPSNGLYYTTNTSGMDIGSIASGVTQFVLVARNGPVKLPTDLSSSELIGRTFTAYNHATLPRRDVMIVSGFGHTQPCDQFAIEKSGNRGAFNGIFWAPKAMVRWSGNEATLNGCIISHAFQMNGNLHRLNQNPTLCGSGSGSSNPTVSLVK